MAMLQLGGTLSNSTVRIAPRASFWITDHNLLCSTPLSTILKPALGTTKTTEDETVKSNKLPNVSKEVDDKLLVSNALKQVIEFNAKKNLTDKINAAVNVNELLNITYDPNFQKENAFSILFILKKWNTEGKFQLSEIMNDTRYLKIYKYLRNNEFEKISSFLTKGNSNTDIVKSTINEIIQTELTRKQLNKVTVSESISILTMLAKKQKRQIPLLNVFSSKIIASNNNLSIKELSDVLYSIAVLNYCKEELIKKMCDGIIREIPKNQNSAVVGSILKSINKLQYRHEKLLEVLSDWILKNESILRPQEIKKLLSTLACLGYTPKNFNRVMEKIVLPLTEDNMPQSSDWLEIVWALTVLNRVTLEQYASVLNKEFLNRLHDLSEVSISNTVKLLNINAAAQLEQPNYKGPLLSENSAYLNTILLRSKDKITLAHLVTSALKILLPSDSIYLNVNINTDMGFVLDAEFCVDKKCTPLPINSKSDKNKQVYRIGILIASYHEHCRGMNVVTGPVQLYKRLLEKQDYKVFLIPYTDMRSTDTLITRVKYINDNIKTLVQNTCSKHLTK